MAPSNCVCAHTDSGTVLYLTELYSGERHISRLFFHKHVRNCCSHPRAYVDWKRSGALPGAGMPSSSASASARLLDDIDMFFQRLVDHQHKVSAGCRLYMSLSAKLAGAGKTGHLDRLAEQPDWPAPLPAAKLKCIQQQAQPHHASAATGRFKNRTERCHCILACTGRWLRMHRQSPGPGAAPSPLWSPPAPVDTNCLHCPRLLYQSFIFGH